MELIIAKQHTIGAKCVKLGGMFIAATLWSRDKGGWARIIALVILSATECLFGKITPKISSNKCNKTRHYMHRNIEYRFYIPRTKTTNTRETAIM